jgi:outer membrane protein TolC
MPLLDIGTWVRGAAIKPSVAATEESIKARQLDVQRQVARTYYQFGGAAAFIDSAERNLKVAEDNLTLVKARREGGVASELDVARAAAQLESSKQSLVGAQLQLALAKRALRSLSGIEPNEGIIAFDGNLENEAPLENWEGRSQKNLIPALRAAELGTIAQKRNATGFYLAFIPTVVGMVQEHISNVTGFVGKHDTYLAQLTANWTLDLTTFFTAREQSAQAAIMQAREDRTRLQVLDSIHQSWQQVKSYIANTRAAEAQAKAAALALQIARDRYEGGAATQLEVVQAERDAFVAEVSLIQDRGDLAYSRIELRLFSGQSIEGAP